MQITQREVRENVGDPEWQDFRVRLHGLPTKVKLERLEGWWNAHQDLPAAVQVQNYINALKRAGQVPTGEPLPLERLLRR